MRAIQKAKNRLRFERADCTKIPSTPTAMRILILLTVNKLPVDMPNLLQNFSFSECATINPNYYLNDITQIGIFGSGNFNSISKLKSKKYFGKECTNLTAEKNPVALPDTIHNTCVWAAKKYHPQIHTNGSMWSIHGPYTCRCDTQGPVS